MKLSTAEMASICAVCVVFIAKSVTALSMLESDSYSMNINMPDVKPNVPDAYICTAKKLNPVESYIIQYEPDADGRTAHHMLLFGCDSLYSQNHLYPGHWNCGGDLCRKMTIMYGWAKNAPAMKLPRDVGFLVGGNSSIQYLVLQIHYAKPLPEEMTDNSGLKLHMTTQRQTYVTGIHLLLAGSGLIPQHHPKYHIDVNCRFRSNIPIYVFAYRVHTHKLGTVVSGYKYNLPNTNWTFLAKGNPQWPQAFYPIHHQQAITSGDILAARCTYNSSGMNRPTKIGSSSNDEMCNLYLMYYTEYRNGFSDQLDPCTGIEFMDLVQELPPGNDVPLPSNSILEQRAHLWHGHSSDPVIKYNNVQNEATNLRHSFGPLLHPPPVPEHQPGEKTYDDKLHSKDMPIDENTVPLSHFNSEFRYNEVYGWPSKDLKFGQIAAVTVDGKGNVIIFHRADHVWNELTFDVAHNYLLVNDGPISVPTVIAIDSVTGLIQQQWGSNLFYMPHGLFVNHDGSFWVTDVALHQIFHFPAFGAEQPLLALGEKFVPGNDREHFCKPTSVAISSNGDIYVADGYCNSRIIRFSSDGTFLNQWGKQDSFFRARPPVGTFNIPHKVILLEDRDLVCVADRENGRIQCFAMVTGQFRFQIQREEFGGTLYSIAYSQDKGLLYGVSGEAVYKDHAVKAFVFNATDQKLLNVFSPASGTFTRPHDIAVSHDSDEAYICEIGPNTVWRFTRDYHKSTKKVLVPEPTSDSTSSASPELQSDQTEVVTSNTKQHSMNNPKDASDLSDEMDSFETSMIIMALLGIPVLVLILITVVLRLRKRGKLQSCSLGHIKGWLGGYRTPHPQDKFNLGNILNPHKGFDRVAMEESDGEEDGSDSDVEEFSAVSKKA